MSICSSIGKIDVQQRGLEMALDILGFPRWVTLNLLPYIRWIFATSYKHRILILTRFLCTKIYTLMKLTEWRSDLIGPYFTWNVLLAERRLFYLFSHITNWYITIIIGMFSLWFFWCNQYYSLHLHSDLHVPLTELLILRTFAQMKCKSTCCHKLCFFLLKDNTYN